MASGQRELRQSTGVPPLWADLAAGALLLGAIGVAAMQMLGLPAAIGYMALIVYAAMAALIAAGWPDARRALGAANRVTLIRAVLVALLAGALVSPDALDAHAPIFAAVALVALLLDGVDGWVARRFDAASDFGARFDMELDAFLIGVLCLQPVLLGKVGPWVLAIGAMRYAFVAAMPVWRWLDRPLPHSLRRKIVCVWQVASLLVCLLPAVDAAATAAILGLALLLLGASFVIDVRWLYRQRMLIQ